MTARRVATAVLVAALLSGCTATTAAAPQPLAVPTADPVADGVTLPVDAYALTVADIGRIARAREVLIGDCLRRLGLAANTRIAVTRVDTGTANQIRDFGTYGKKRRYGVTDPTVAATYGYHLASTVDGTAAVSVETEADPHGLGTLDETERVALTGSGAARVNGHPVPPGGCRSAAERSLAPDGDLGESRVVATLDRDSYQRSLSDPAVVTVISGWAGCMRLRGHPYPTPSGAAGAFDIHGAGVPPEEIAAAVADVECKRLHDVVGVWRRVETAYQESFVRAHTADLRRVRADHDAVLRRVTKVFETIQA